MKESFGGYSTDSMNQQQSIQNKCFHPRGVFIAFDKKDIEQSIPQRFEKQVQMYPNRLAVKTKKHTLTYKELDMRANRIAQSILKKRGEKKEPISLLFKHDASMLSAILGVLKAGKIYVPLDSSFPTARLNFILEDSQTELVVSDNENQSLAEEFTRSGYQLMNVDHLDPSISSGPPGLSISPDDPIYILYTSGSTGQPKGVIQNHRHRLHDIMIHTNGLHICAADRLGLLYSCSTGMGTTVLFSALLNGAALYPFDLKEEGIGALSAWLVLHKISIYTSITSILRHFFDNLDGDQEFPALRVIYQSGEPLYKRDVDLYKKYFAPDCVMVNGLGAGETARLRRYFIDKATHIAGGVVPIGYPVEDKEVLLLDNNRHEVGFNQIGEIAIKSHYLSPGYWRRPDLTDTVFLSNPEWGGKRIYLTGDLGKMSPDGCLMHMGRKDFQVKIRGNRVEIPEVEAALYNLKNVKETVVIAREDTEGDRRLTAYVVPEKTQPPEIVFLRDALAETLPDYMIPSVFVFMDSLPRLPNGKIDRLSLPAPDRGRLGPEENFVAPRDDLEQNLARIWEKILKIEPVGIRDDFFLLGGDSLRALALSVQIEKTLGKKLPLAILCQASTIEQLATKFRENGWAQPWSSLAPLQTEGSKPPFFCVHGAGGYAMFYIDLARRLGSGQPVYGLQAKGLDGKQQPLDRIEAISKHYIEEMRSIQPQGPYFLGGFCLGTYIVLDMARQLQDKGQEVPLLASFNGDGSSRIVNSLREDIQLHLRRLSTLETRKKFAYLADRTKYRLSRGKSRLGNMLYEHGGRAIRALSPGLLTIHVQELSHRARVLYAPRTYHGRMTYFLAADDAFKQPQKYWPQVASDGIEVHMVPGKGIGIFKEPNVEVLSQKLQACLDRAQEDY